MYADLCSDFKADSHGPTVLTDTHATHSEIVIFTVIPCEHSHRGQLRQLHLLLLSYHVNGPLQIL